MINIDLKFKDGKNAVSLQDEVLFNALLSQRPEFIKKLIKNMSPFYRIKEDYFEVINPFVDIDKNGMSLYAGLIVRTSFDKFAVIYLEKSTLNEKYMTTLISSYLHDRGEDVMNRVDIVKFEVTKKNFLKSL